MADLKEYRDGVMTHLMYIKEQMDTNHTYIKEKVDANHSHLKTLNGRINKAENNISKITSIGSTFGFIITIIMSYFGFRK